MTTTRTPALAIEPPLTAYAAHLRREERAGATIEKYTRDIRAFAAWLDGAAITKDAAVAYKEHLVKTRAPAGVNAVIAALNGFFAYLKVDIKLKPLKIQRQTYTDASRELTRAEYVRLIAAAQHNGGSVWLVLQTICATGIRVSELRYITAEAARQGFAVITNKGKTRTVFLPKGLTAQLCKYIKEQKIESGCIFIARNGRPIDRRSVWFKMKKLCSAANVNKAKVFPHNLRRLFARTFYAKHKDIVKLADILGHSDVRTTRIYVMESGDEHRKRVDCLGLVFPDAKIPRGARHRRGE